MGNCGGVGQEGVAGHDLGTPDLEALHRQSGEPSVVRLFSGKGRGWFALSGC